MEEDADNKKAIEDKKMQQWQFQVPKNEDARQQAYSWVEFLNDQHARMSKKKKKEDPKQSNRVVPVDNPLNHQLRQNANTKHKSGTDRQKQLNEDQMKSKQNDEDLKNRKKIECSWEYRMFHMLNGLGEAANKTEEVYTAKIKLNLFFNQFVTICETKAKDIIDDYTLPPGAQKYADQSQAIFNYNPTKGIKKYYFKEERLYLYVQLGQRDIKDEIDELQQLRDTHSHIQTKKTSPSDILQKLDSQQFNHRFKSNKVFFE